MATSCWSTWKPCTRTSLAQNQSRQLLAPSLSRRNQCKFYASFNKRLNFESNFLSSTKANLSVAHFWAWVSPEEPKTKHWLILLGISSSTTAPLRGMSMRPSCECILLMIHPSMLRLIQEILFTIVQLHGTAMRCSSLPDVYSSNILRVFNLLLLTSSQNLFLVTTQFAEVGES